MRAIISPMVAVLAALAAIGFVQAELQTADLGSSDPFPGLDGPILPNRYLPIKVVGPYGMLGGDFNEDGNKDLAAFGRSGLLILLGNGDRTFSQTKYFGGYGTGAIGDLNEDGHQDLVLAMFGGQGAEAWAGRLGARSKLARRPAQMAATNAANPCFWWSSTLLRLHQQPWRLAIFSSSGQVRTHIEGNRQVVRDLRLALVYRSRPH